MNASRGDLEFSEKSKKEKVRSLSAVDEALSMGCRVSHSHKPTKKFNLPRKVPPLVLVLVSYVCRYFRFRDCICEMFFLIFNDLAVSEGLQWR